VTGITLSNHGISNPSIFASLCLLDTLLSLDLSVNNFTNLGEKFPAASCHMKKGLLSLDLSNNQLSHRLRDFSGLPQLEVLDLSFNLFTDGNLSSDLGSFPKLRSLNLSSNKLNGDVPVSMTSSLEELVLSGNHLSGTIPPGVFKYGNLTLLDLSQNHLTGIVPDKFMRFFKLETLLLSGNRLSGRIPESLWNVKTLSRFAANKNNFTGTIPSGIANHVRILDLSYNMLSGKIPPDFLSHKGLQTVDLTSNMLEGTVPSHLSGSLYRLRLGGNRLSGNIPRSVCDGMGLMYLELDDNQLMGNIPAELSKCKDLSLLNLASNKLQGSVPAAISSLDKLVVLKLQNNSLSGSIPNTFYDLRSLTTMNLSHNSLTGLIPSGIFELQLLSTLDLQGNNIEGVIPNSISSSKSLIELNLGYNALTGIIPTMPTTLSTSLNLSRNHLSGSIPSDLSYLSELEILDLSYNHLSGEVPSSLGSLQSLEQLVLSYNNLSGSVPTFRQQVAIDINGNPDLENHTENNNHTRKRRAYDVVVIIFVATGALVGLCYLVVIATMISFPKRMYRVESGSIPTGEGVPQINNGCLMTMNCIRTSAIVFMKEKQDDWRITAFQALNFDAADMRQGLTEENLVGSGGSGHVYRVTYNNRDNSSTGVVAVKQIRSVGSLDEKLECEFESEASILCDIRHNNIVKLLCCLSTSECKLLVYDYMDNGSLDRWLHGDYVLRAAHPMARARPVQRVPLDWPTRLIVAVGAAQGLCYMHHNCSPPIIHRDVKTSNILLDSEFRAKVADFGLARMLVQAGEPNTMTWVVGSLGYMAPGKDLLLVISVVFTLILMASVNWDSSTCSVG
jgi:Leucine-rich repeat (LRR) protein